MKLFRHVVPLGVALVLLAAVGPARASPPSSRSSAYPGYAQSSPGYAQVNQSYYSHKLGVWLRHEWMQIPGYVFVGARLVSEPGFDSPLARLFLHQQDVITRLDGIPISQTFPDNHFGPTTVRFIRHGSFWPEERSTWLPDGGGPMPPFPYGSPGGASGTGRP